MLAMAMAASMALTMMTGCSSTPSSSSSTPTSGDSSSQSSQSAIEGAVKIGLLAPLTGEVAVYGTAVRNGAELAFEEINAQGGLQFDVEVLDEKGDVNEAINAYNMLLSKEIAALLGDVTSKPSIAVAELAAEDNVPMITATGTAADITQKGDNIFRTCFMDPTQGKAMATFAKETLKAEKVAIMYNTSDDYSVGVATAFKETAEASGMTVEAYEGYGNDDKDFKTQLTTIGSKDVDVLFVPDYYNKVALIIAQAREVGYDKPILGADGFDGVVGAVSADNTAILNNVYFSNHYSTSDESEKVQSFLKNYQAKYGEMPNSFAALAYDTAYILKDAFERAGSVEPDAVVAALAATDYEGVTGHITFDDNGDSVKGISIIEIKDGQYTLNSKVVA